MTGSPKKSPPCASLWEGAANPHARLKIIDTYPVIPIILRIGDLSPFWSDATFRFPGRSASVIVSRSAVSRSADERSILGDICIEPEVGGVPTGGEATHASPLPLLLISPVQERVMPPSVPGGACVLYVN